MRELWQPVLGFGDWYEISNLGRLRSIQKPVRGGPRCFNETYPLIMTPLRWRKGYLKYRLGKCEGINPTYRAFFAHRLVYEAFRGAIPAGLTVNHIDNDHSNNRLVNLELATHQEQHAHARKSGVIWWPTKTGVKRPHLKAADIRCIRNAYGKRDNTQRALADKYGVTTNAIRSILNRITWKHIA